MTMTSNNRAVRANSGSSKKEGNSLLDFCACETHQRQMPTCCHIALLLFSQSSRKSQVLVQATSPWRPGLLGISCCAPRQRQQRLLQEPPAVLLPSTTWLRFLLRPQNVKLRPSFRRGSVAVAASFVEKSRACLTLESALQISILTLIVVFTADELCGSIILAVRDERKPISPNIVHGFSWKALYQRRFWSSLEEAGNGSSASSVSSKSQTSKIRERENRQFWNVCVYAITFGIPREGASVSSDF